MASRKNPKISEIERILSDILDPQEQVVFAVRNKDCEIVFANAIAKNRFCDGEESLRNCKAGFARCLPGICDYCHLDEKEKGALNNSFKTEDIEGRTYLVRCSTVNWIDNKLSSVFFMEDITQEKEMREQLYALAYTDQLTGVPNRQKLKEDFSALEERIANNTLSGIAALFDLDSFKTINDTYGHNTGDLVLRRLTEHLQSDKAFLDHLYRIGGDEFVLLYAEPAGKYGSDEEMISYYTDLLSTALCAYTLPNIEVKCTLSIGVSLFPRHGDNLSEVLRKADIALYKAKARGRNRVVFFESQYDAVQKFKDLYISIQPILTAAGKTLGYELVDRGNSYKDDDNNSDTVNLNEFSRTVDALGLHDIENNELYFIAYTKQFLSPAVLKNLPRDKFIVQVQLSSELTATEMQNKLQICIELRKHRYKLALVGLHSNSKAEALLELADYCKFSAADKNTMKQKTIIASNKNIRFIAPDVDSQEAFKAAKDTGFHLFQGFHFNQPALENKTKEIVPLKANYFRLMKLSGTDDYMDFREISSIISADVALSYKLLRILNSAAVGLKNVSSVSIAVAYLGEESLKKWIAVLALRGIAEDKPLELVRMSLIRARFGELLAPHFRIKREPRHVFMVGLLSLLHVALDMSQDQFLEDIPVADEIRESLVTKRGVYSDLLKFYENYEYSNWEAVSQFVHENQLDAQYVSDAYISSVKWYNDLEN